MPNKSKEHAYVNVGISLLTLLRHLRVQKCEVKAGRFLSSLYRILYVRRQGWHFMCEFHQLAFSNGTNLERRIFDKIL
jgi:hypothetical protein